MQLPKTKAELGMLYGISRGTIQTLMNKTYFEDLKAVGYEKKNRLLSPKVVRKFIDCHGEPLSENDFLVQFD